MRYSLPWLLTCVERGERLKYLLFWSHQPAPNGRVTAACFSQWWPAAFVVDNVRYATAEHWMMAHKARLFGDAAAFASIVAAKSPGEAKALGRLVRGFDEAVWEEQRSEIVLQGCLHKFGQDAALRAFLLQTNDRILVEASPVDAIWGIGLAAEDDRAVDPAQWPGLNLLGFALMEARDILRR